jgi:hypothetical protein
VSFTLILNISTKSQQDKRLAVDESCDRFRKGRVVVGWTMLMVTAILFLKEIQHERIQQISESGRNWPS